MAKGGRDGIVLLQLQGWLLREVLRAVRSTSHHQEYQDLLGRADGRDSR